MKIRSALIYAAALMALSAPAVQMAQASNLSGAQIACPQSVVDADSVQFFKAGVKFDPTTHHWVDKYNGKMMDLGLPGVSERFGAGSVISAVSPPSSSANATTTTTTTAASNSTFPWKKVIIFTGIGCLIATSIAVPIACGVSAGHHHHHHLQNDRQANQAALYYYYHNQTIPSQLNLPSGPPVFIHHKPVKPPRFL